ncbi:MAG TPA: TonB-dependent receptor plug domain-containing protein, partial [Aquabacterium sp.]|nr:TonB-dependent receptor plug domain-containing protein [Aquabacterium sp.]
MSRHNKSTPVLPLGALAAGLGLSLLSSHAGAQTEAATTEAPAAQQTLPAVSVKAKKPVVSEATNNYQTTTTTIGKGKQALRDIPQSVTVVTEKLIDDRNLDTVKEALKNTAGITFLAAEGGEEDIRLRGFSLQGTGDIFVDGMRDPAFYERDTFNLDRLEVLRGSASMLFGRGSTGGAVNQVSKAPFLMNAHEVSTTLGTHNYGRVTGDFNFQIGEDAAVRFNAMATKADNNGAGTRLDKQGLSAAIRWGIGTADEFQVSYYYLDNANGMNYGMPWIRPNATSTAFDNTLITRFDPADYYGLDSDYNHSSANLFTATHTHRFTPTTELKTSIRHGAYTRDQRASTVRFANPAPTLESINDATVLNRGNQVKIQDMEILMLQSDLSTRFEALGFNHQLIGGIDYASEEKRVYNALTAVTKPTTTVGAGSGG